MRDMNSEFKSYHPVVNFVYFFAVTGFSMLVMHPLFLCISAFGASMLVIILKRNKAVRFLSMALLPVIIISSLFNPLFNHGGEVVLWYFPDGNPLTLESLVYGFFAGVMLSAVICWFSSFNEIMTSDKLMYLMGRFVPSLSLIFSMTLRFVPRFSHQLKKTVEAQRCLKSEGTGIRQRARRGVRILSAMISFALESSVKTADTMKARGYGMGKRTNYSIYTIRGRDIAALLFIAVCSASILYVYFTGKVDYRYFPDISFEGGLYSLPFAALCIFPTGIELWEVIRWKYLRSGI